MLSLKILNNGDGQKTERGEKMSGVNLEGLLTIVWLLLTLVLCIATFFGSYHGIGVTWASVLTLLVAVGMIVVAIIFKRLFSR